MNTVSLPILPRGSRYFWSLAGCISLATACILLLQVSGCRPDPTPSSARADGYLLCFWNVENFFDDQNDHRTGPDEQYDAWFAEEKQDLDLKIKHLTEALLEMNGGRGPDIIALAEVETERAAQLLMDSLNHSLKEPDLQYRHLLFKEIKAGRHIATAIITRVDVAGNKTQLLDHQRRILEGHLLVDGHELVLIASHWTSRLTDHDGKEDGGRAKYGDEIYGRFRAMHHSNPKVDFIVCGDFNDSPEDKSVVEHLHAIGSADKVEHAPADAPLLLDLFADKNPKEFGTHFDEGRWIIFDQFAVSPGLLDNEGWHCDVGSAHAVRTFVRKGDKTGQPWRFGNRKNSHERGYSDHFPVTVVLKVAGGSHEE
jgi:endonuclease/exonuclease/phosphatase family metal-dependent hydrolase